MGEFIDQSKEVAKFGVREVSLTAERLSQEALFFLHGMFYRAEAVSFLSGQAIRSVTRNDQLVSQTEDPA
jgi:hypothetical protein